MKKTLVVIIIIISACCGYLYYDWHTKTKQQAAEPSSTQYSWTDAQGTLHFTDTAPPEGATNIEKTRSYKYINPPLVVSIKNKVVEYYGQIKEKLFTPKKKRRKKE